jgi:hypothetical protein
MKKSTLLGLLLIFSLSVSYAQKPQLLNKEDSLKYGWWTRNTQLAANLSGSAFSQNWQGGGINNIVLGGVFANKADFFKGKGVWTNDIQLQLGTLSNYSKDKPRETRKNLDRLFAETKYAKKINAKTNWFVGATLLSQMIKGYDYSNDKLPIISNFFAPAFFTQGIGLEYKPKPYFFISLGGATLRQTVVANQKVWDSEYYKTSDKVFGVEKGKKLRLEGGFQAVAAFDKNLTPKLNLKWRWQTFSPYTFKAFDHNVSAMATYKLNKYINLNATVLGIYDWDQTGPKDLKPWQINGGANLGFAVQL